MRTYITSSIANVISRRNSAAVDSLRMVSDPAAYLQHVQLCTEVQKPNRLLTVGVNAQPGISDSLSRPTATFLEAACQWLFMETTGGKEMLCPSTTGSSGSPRVS